MILSDASTIAHNYALNKPCKFKVLKLEDCRVVFMAAAINGDYMYRCSTAGLRKADISPSGKLIIVYHTLVQSATDPNILTMPLDEARDAAKFIAHVPEMIEARKSPDYKYPPYPDIPSVKPSNSREILIGTMPNLKPVYESTKNLKVNFNYLELDDAG